MRYFLALIVILYLPASAASGSSGKSRRSMRSISALSNSSDSSIAKLKLTFPLMPQAALVTDTKITALLNECIKKKDYTLYNALTTITEKGGVQKTCVDDIVLQRGAEHTIQKITAKTAIADRRSLVLSYIEIKQTLAARHDAWQVYHMSVLNELKPLIESAIPGITADISDLSVSCDGTAPAALTPNQLERLHMHIIAFALLLSEQELLDKTTFDHDYSSQLALSQVKQKKDKKCILQ
jgi:hypothetical protein